MADKSLANDQLEQTAEGTTSPKATRRQQRKAEKERRQGKRSPQRLEARTEHQAQYIEHLRKKELTFGIGPAGVGKTYVPARVYGEMLANGSIDKIYVARPNVAKAKHRMGYLPGTMEDKTAPWLVPIFEGLRDAMGSAEFERARREKKIEEVPYEFMQGRTFRDAACIVDEAENLDLDDLYITLTRQGEDLRMVLCGDPRQARISNSGLLKVVQMAQAPWMEEVAVVEFGEDDVVRSRQARQWVMAFNRMNLFDGDNCAKDETESFKENLPTMLRKED